MVCVNNCSYDVFGGVAVNVSCDALDQSDVCKLAGTASSWQECGSSLH